MSRTEFKSWMKANDLTEIDIAAALKIHPITVTRYLKGETVRRSTQAMFERYRQSYDQSRLNNKFAAS